MGKSSITDKLSFRVKKATMAWLVMKAERKHMNLSEYMRWLLEYVQERNP